MYIKCITHKYCTHSLYTSSLDFILTLTCSYTSPFPSLFFSFLPFAMFIGNRWKESRLFPRCTIHYVYARKKYGKIGLYINCINCKITILIDILIRNIFKSEFFEILSQWRKLFYFSFYEHIGYTSRFVFKK